MGNFDKGGRGGFGGSRGGGKSFGSGDGKRGGFGGGNREQSMHKVKCSDCGNMAEVPFRPTGDKPVFCNDCFGGKKDGGFRKPSFEGRFENREPFGMKKHPSTGTLGPKRRIENSPLGRGDTGLSRADVEKVVSELHTKIDTLTRMVEGFAAKGLEKVSTVAESASKKLETKAVAKPVAKAVTKKVVAKPAPVAKKVVAKVAAAPKKVAKKAPAKKVAKKAAPKKASK